MDTMTNPITTPSPDQFLSSEEADLQSILKELLDFLAVSKNYLLWDHPGTSIGKSFKTSQVVRHKHMIEGVPSNLQWKSSLGKITPQKAEEANNYAKKIICLAKQELVSLGWSVNVLYHRTFERHNPVFAGELQFSFSIHLPKTSRDNFIREQKTIKHYTLDKRVLSAQTETKPLTNTDSLCFIDDLQYIDLLD